MNKDRNIQKKMAGILVSARNAQVHFSKMDHKQKTSLEKEWDIEHAYYSSSLEGSKVDRKDFEKMGKKIA